MRSKLEEAEFLASTTARMTLIIFGVIVGLIAALLIASQFTNGLIRSHAERAMNEKLTGYHSHVAGAYLNLIDGDLTLKGVTVVQNAHPVPAVMQISSMTAHIQWTALFTGHIVAGFVIRRPHLHIDLVQLEQQATSKVPVSQEGWQQALQNLYPFKINRFAVENGELTYVESKQQPALHLEHLYLIAANIRNIYSPRKTYPSWLWARAIAFNQGDLIISGYANFLAQPFAAVWVRYWLDQLPLKPFDPVISRANLTAQSGVMRSNGILQYAPWGEKAEVYNATIYNIYLTYLHSARTAALERTHAAELERAAKQVNNKPGLQLKIDKLDLVKSWLSYEDQAATPPYSLYFTDLMMSVSNFSNHFTLGNSALDMNGKFMGSGNTVVTGEFRPETQGSDFALNIAIKDTNLPSLNNLLSNYGKFDVARGWFSVFAQISVKEGQIHGYVKPLFNDLKVYSYRRDKNQSIIKQVYELAVGALSHLLRNHRTEDVATQVDLSGHHQDPNVSTWQAVVELIRNAFIKAILPGFDYQVARLTPVTK
jgi:hypothetical protein